MLDQLLAAFERQDYPQMARLLAALPPQDPWRILYQGRLWEVTDEWQQAEAAYRQLLQTDCILKISSQARQGLQRLAELRQAQQQQAIAEATAHPQTTELGVLVLSPIPAAAKAEAAQQFAQIMQIDPYLARMLLPSRGWRLYRTGAIGELQVYGQQLQAAGIPSFWRSLASIAQIPVIQVRSIESAGAQITIVSEPAGNPGGSFTFAALDVTQRVEGRLPIFESVVDLDPHGKLQRKSKTQDHAQICDLHLGQRGCILRFHDSGYQFHQGLDLTPSPGPPTDSLKQQTAWANWQGLLHFLNQRFPECPIWTEFEIFAATALDHPHLLRQLSPQINLFRRSASDWDPAFHLYSALVFATH